jgi:hypothetical protein
MKVNMESKVEIFRSKDNNIELRVAFDADTVWLSQEHMGELFGRNRVAITQHIGNIFREGELDQQVVCKDFLRTTQHGAIKGKGQTKSIKLYNLDVIISVGYRVKSQRGTQFRQWATQRLRDYLVQGYAINDKRLAQKQLEVEYLKTGICILSYQKPFVCGWEQTNCRGLFPVFPSEEQCPVQTGWKARYGQRNAGCTHLVYSNQ